MQSVHATKHRELMKSETGIYFPHLHSVMMSARVLLTLDRTSSQLNCITECNAKFNLVTHFRSLITLEHCFLFGPSMSRESPPLRRRFAELLSHSKMPQPPQSQQEYGLQTEASKIYPVINQKEMTTTIQNENVADKSEVVNNPTGTLPPPPILVKQDLSPGI